MAEALSDLQHTIDTTRCPHAKMANLVMDVIEPLPGDLELGDAVWQRVQAYAQHEQSSAPDGLFLSLPRSMFGENIDGLAQGFKRLFCRMVELDGGNPEEELANATDPDWRFTVADIGFHPILFDSMYPQDNPRHTPSDRVLLLLLTESSFNRHMSKYPDGSEERRQHRTGIQHSFARSGKPYRKHLGSRALRYLSPLDAVNDPPVEWYL